MKQIDFVGEVLSPSVPFSDIANTRPGVASDKAVALLRLGELIRKVPPKLMQGGSINEVRAWRAELAAARKVAGGVRSSLNQIRSAISSMERHWG